MKDRHTRTTKDHRMPNETNRLQSACGHASADTSVQIAAAANVCAEQPLVQGKNRGTSSKAVYPGVESDLFYEMKAIESEY